MQWAPAPPALQRHCLAPALTFVWYGTATVALLWDCLAEASIEVGRVGTCCVVLYVFGRGRRLIGLYWHYRCRWSRTVANLSYIEQMLPDRWCVEGFCHEVCNLLFGVTVANADLGSSAYLEKPADINPVSTRKVSQGSGSAFANDLNHCLVVLGYDQIRDMVRRSSVGVVASWVEVEVVPVCVEDRDSGLV